MAADGSLGELLTRVRSNDTESAGDVARRVVERLSEVDRNIDATFDEQRKRHPRARIIAGARNTLRQRYAEALDLCGEWAEQALTAKGIHERIRTEARAGRGLENLRSNLASVRIQALDELVALRADCEQDPGGAASAAAAGACLVMLTEAFAACDGRPQIGGEPSPGWVLYGGLLDTDVRLTADPLEPTDHGETLARSAQVRMQSPEGTPESLYEYRAARGEHDLTAVIIENLWAVDKTAAEVLRLRRDREVDQLREHLSASLDRLASQVDQAQSTATLPDGVWSTLAADLEALRLASRRDFASMESEVDRIIQTLDRHRHDQGEQVARRVEERAKHLPAVAAHRSTLDALVAGGDLAGAEEYLELLTTGGTLPEAKEDFEHLERFFPQVPDFCAENPGLLPELRLAIDGGERSEGVTRLLQMAGVDLEASTPATRHAAARAIGAWHQLASSPNQTKIDVPAALRYVLEACGIEFSEAEVEKKRGQAGRHWVQLRGVRGVGLALSPALGSHMSPSGSSLRVLLAWKKVAPATLIEWARDGQPDSTVLILALGSAYTAQERRALSNAARGHARPVTIVIDHAVMSYLCIQPEARRTTLALVTLPFTADCPYRDVAGDTAPEMFYGRTDERDAVMDLNGPSFVSGGRQLGKSALLRSAARRFDDGTRRRAVFREIRVVGADGNPQQLWPMLQATLHSAGITPAPLGDVTAESAGSLIMAWLNEDAERALLILVDEADHFLTADAQNNRFTHVSACKHLMEQSGRRVKFVFAGLHRTARFESLANQPLAHLGRPIIVGPLRPQAAHDLLTRPLSALGYRFSDPLGQPARILAVTNNVPSLLQLFGKALVGHLSTLDVSHGPPQIITDSDIDAVLDDSDLRDAFREKYVLTLNLDHRYLVIVYAIALAAHEHGVDQGLTVNELAEQCRIFWPAGFSEMGLDHLRGLVTECCDVGLLALDQARYRMRTPTVLRLLGNAEAVAEVLYSAEERLQLPSPLAAQSHRVRLDNSHRRAPLTARQLSEIFVRRTQMIVVAGTQALGVNRVSASLDQVKRDGRAAGAELRPLPNTTPASLVSAAGRVTRQTVFVADLRHSTGSQLRELMDAAPEAHEIAQHPIVIVLVVDTASAPVWARSNDLLELSRVDAAGLNLWIDETNAPFHTAEDQKALLDMTGGWPSLVEEALASPSEDIVAPGRANIDVLRDRLLDSDGRVELVASAGVGLDDQPVTTALRAALTIALDLTAGGGASLETISDLLVDADTDGRLVALAAAAGFADVSDTLVVLRAIGAFARDPSGDLVVEPVLAAAFLNVSTIEQRR
jgi:hypothetical protein